MEKSRIELLRETREMLDGLADEMLQSVYELVKARQAPNYCLDCGKHVHRTSHSLLYATHRYSKGKVTTNE